MEEAKQLSAHVVAWNHLSHLEPLLDSLDAQTWRDFQLVIVDNAATDRAEETIGERSDIVRLRNFRNLGFARAHNQAMAFALTRWNEAELDRRFVAFLAPDVALAADCLERLMGALQNDPALTVAGPKLFLAERVLSSEDGDEEAKVVATDTIVSTGMQLTKSRRVRERGSGERGAHAFDDKPDVFGFDLGCVVVRASALKAAGVEGEWLDQSLHEGQEIADLMWRLRWFGAKVAFVPEAVAWIMPSSNPPSRGLVARLKRWYGNTASRQRLAREERRLFIAKNDVCMNRLIHAPWIWADGIRFFFLCLLDPRLAYASLRAIGALPRAATWKAAMMKKRNVTSRTLRQWFV